MDGVIGWVIGARSPAAETNSYGIAGGTEE